MDNVSLLTATRLEVPLEGLRCEHLAGAYLGTYPRFRRKNCTKCSRWRFGLAALVFIVFPDALTQRLTGDDPNMKFYKRVLDYLLVKTYSVFTIVVYCAAVAHLRGRSERGGGMIADGDIVNSAEGPR